MDQINAVPYNLESGLNEIDEMLAPMDIEFNFNLIENIEHSLNYLTEFDKRFGSFIEHLVQISHYMTNKEFFYHCQIEKLGE